MIIFLLPKSTVRIAKKVNSYKLLRQTVLCFSTLLSILCFSTLLSIILMEGVKRIQLR